jgi:tetratricopeptide (TPR) repeat protein
VLQVRFATEVQFQRAIATRSGDLVLVSYNLLTTTNNRLQTANQVLRLRASRGLPDIEIADEPDRGEQARRLVVRMAEVSQAAVRAGRNNRSIEIVLRGKGAGLAQPTAGGSPAATAAVPAAVPGAAPVAAPPATPAPVIGAPRGTPELEAKAEALMHQARSAFDAGRWSAALEALNQLLELPPTSQTRAAQELAGLAHQKNGDLVRARAEFETYLQLFPTGEDSERVRRALAALPAAPAAAATATAVAPAADKEVTISGSTSMTYYGGNGQIRSRDFQDSPISGLPQVAGDPQLSSDRTRQLYTDVDFNWRRRNAEVDQRFVLRDSYTSDLQRSDKSKNRLSALYFDHKSLPGGWGLRVGRQSPTGGGVMGRFDGLSGSWTVRPRVKLGAVAGAPTESLFDSKRRFVGVSADADRLLGSLGGGLYAIEQRIDGQTDRRAIGLDLRWFQGGATVFSQFDYDLLIGALNIASVQGTLILPDNTVLNALYDRRALSTLTLGNALTFGDPANPGVLFRTIQDKLATTTLSALRNQIKRSTPMVTQAQLGITKPWSKNWQTAASVQLTNTGAIPPVPEVAGFELGRPATGNIITTSGQLIGLNLYSARDTHVLSASFISSPSLKGTLVAYNNSSFLAEVWQVEPTLQFYRDHTDQGSRSRRWTPGLRITYRGWQRWALESNLSYEIGRASRQSADPLLTGGLTTTEESTRRVTYSLGARYEF